MRYMLFDEAFYLFEIYEARVDKNLNVFGKLIASVQDEKQACDILRLGKISVKRKENKNV